MIKRALSTSIAGVALLTLFAWVYGQFAGTGASTTRKHTLPPPASAKPWDGTAQRTYDAALWRAGDQMTLQQGDYSLRPQQRRRECERDRRRHTRRATTTSTPTVS